MYTMPTSSKLAVLIESYQLHAKYLKASTDEEVQWLYSQVSVTSLMGFWKSIMDQEANIENH